MRWLMEIVVPVVLFLLALILIALLFGAVVRYAWSGMEAVRAQKTLAIPHDVR